MAGVGRDGELMKFKASGGENLHAANGATFSSVPSASCQETGLIGLEELGRVGGRGRRGWKEGVALRETRQQTPSKLLHFRPATTGQHTTVTLDWLVF